MKIVMNKILSKFFDNKNIETINWAKKSLLVIQKNF